MDFLGVRKNRTKARPLLTRESPSYPRRAARRGGHQIHVAAAARFALVAERGCHRRRRRRQGLPRGQNPRGLTRSRATERALPRRGALERATQSRCRFWPQTTQKVSRSHASRESAGLITLKQMRHSLPSSSGSRRRSLACFFLHAKQLNENTEAFTQPDNIACLQLSKLNIQPYRCPMTSIPPRWQSSPYTRESFFLHPIRRVWVTNDFRTWLKEPLRISL